MVGGTAELAVLGVGGTGGERSHVSVEAKMAELQVFSVGLGASRGEDGRMKRRRRDPGDWTLWQRPVEEER